MHNLLSKQIDIDYNHKFQEGYFTAPQTATLKDNFDWYRDKLWNTLNWAKDRVVMTVGYYSAVLTDNKDKFLLNVKEATPAFDSLGRGNDLKTA